MKKSSIFLFLLFFAFTLVYGQDDKLKKIKQLYTDTNDKIAKSKLPYGDNWGGLYSTEVLVNSNGGSWRALGSYSNKIIFWYYDQPGCQLEQEKSELTVLSKIEVYTTAAAITYYEEYLYEDGKLVFCYKKSNWEDPEQEFRYYFWDGKLFRYQESQTVVKDISKVGVKEITDKSLKLQKLFLQTFD